MVDLNLFSSSWGVHFRLPTLKISKIILSLFATWCVWLTHLSSQQVITLVDIFFFITDVMLLSDHSNSVFPTMIRRCMFVCVCEKFHLCTYAENKLHHRQWTTFPVILNLNWKWKMIVVICISAKLSLCYSGGGRFQL